MFLGIIIYVELLTNRVGFQVPAHDAFFSIAHRHKAIASLFAMAGFGLGNIIAALDQHDRVSKIDFDSTEFFRIRCLKNSQRLRGLSRS